MLEDGNGWDFNVSHSGEYVLVAARKGRIGVDLEKIREVREMKKLVERYFHPEETAAWLDAAEGRKTDVFFRLWTAREAAMKCLGLGLAGGLSITRVDPRFIDSELASAKVGGVAIDLAALPAPEGYVMSLAVVEAL
jgi:phosphopantetheine--protein transferase-like protein